MTCGGGAVAPRRCVVIEATKEQRSARDSRRLHMRVAAVGFSGVLGIAVAQVWPEIGRRRQAEMSSI